MSNVSMFDPYQCKSAGFNRESWKPLSNAGCQSLNAFLPFGAWHQQAIRNVEAKCLMSSIIPPMPLHDWPNRATPYINIYINTIHYVTWLQQIGAYWAHLGPTSNKILRRTLNSCNKVTPSCRPPSPFLQPKLIDLEAKWDPSNPIGARGAG